MYSSQDRDHCLRVVRDVIPEEVEVWRKAVGVYCTIQMNDAERLGVVKRTSHRVLHAWTDGTLCGHQNGCCSSYSSKSSRSEKLTPVEDESPKWVEGADERAQEVARIRRRFAEGREELADHCPQLARANEPLSQDGDESLPCIFRRQWWGGSFRAERPAPGSRAALHGKAPDRNVADIEHKHKEEGCIVTNILLTDQKSQHAAGIHAPTRYHPNDSGRLSPL